jgi:hypothetical protein
MHRRDLLKQIALGIGMVVSTTELTFLASLSQDKTKSWLPSAFTQQDLPTLKAILALMLPSSSTLGADDIELYRFVDHCFAKLLSTEQQTIALNAFSRYRNEHAQLQEADVKKLDAIAFSQVTNETLGSYESVIRFVYKRHRNDCTLGARHSQSSQH